MLSKVVEKKRKKLIEKLIVFHMYKKEEKHLFELSLAELEEEYKKFLLSSHPHGNFESIKVHCKHSDDK